MAFNVAKVASARASLTISLTKSLRVAGPLEKDNSENNRVTIQVLRNAAFLEKNVTKVYGSMLLALRGGGCQISMKKALH